MRKIPTDAMKRMFKKERAEHKSFSNKAIWKIVDDHMKK